MPLALLGKGRLMLPVALTQWRCLLLWLWLQLWLLLYCACWLPEHEAFDAMSDHRMPSPVAGRSRAISARSTLRYTQLVMDRPPVWRRQGNRP